MDQKQPSDWEKRLGCFDTYSLKVTSIYSTNYTDEPATLRNLLQQYEYDSRLGILAWSLSRVGHWDLLTGLANNISEIETRRRHRQYEEWGMTEYL
jgi:hypothetical protein